MTPKEKAKELVDKFQKQIFFAVTDERLDIEEAKGCAIIAVQEIIILLDELPINEDVIEQFAYFIKVKREIKKL